MSRLRRLPETFVPDDAGLSFAFKEGWRAHSRLCDRQPDTEGGRQDKSDGMKVDRNRLSNFSKTHGGAEAASACSRIMSGNSGTVASCLMRSPR